ncbi:fructose-specific PTS transporter subunit EIIC [Lactobacillus crispatus]|uniref:fructose-specific PTS transporter subunit EIIC n=1 Tax=Lactobacillus crispatus TaxID=47770 RepID=UPI003BF57423
MILDVTDENQEQVLRRIATKASELGYINSAEAVTQDFLEREKEFSTGFGNGVAIPHAKSDDVKEATVFFVRLTKGVDWNSMDDSLVKDVIAGGLCMALGSILAQFGLTAVAPKNGNLGSISWALNTVGGLGFTFMVPIMGAYIAYSIGDKPAFAPAFICSYFANTPDLFGKQTGAGFIGAVLLGLAIGYFVRWFKTVKVGKTFQSTMGFLVIPFVTLLLFGLLTWWIVAPVASWLMGVLLHFLNTIPPSMKLIGGFIVGAMLAFDMGGPVNKAAWFFAFSLVGSHVYSWYGVVGVVTTLPPVAVAIACWIKPKLFTKQERGAALPALLVGATVATEPAIPYALAAPLPMISANTLAGAITGALTMLLGVDRIAPGINVLDPLLGLVHPWYNFYICLVVGLILNVTFIIVFKSIWMKKQEEKMAEK